MRIRLAALPAMLAAATLALPSIADAQTRQPPYYVSLLAGKALMRTGPGRNYPANWLYVRAGLPLKVVAVYREWRKVEDPGGTQGWMLRNLLTEKRTAMVQGGIATMHDGPGGGRIAWRAAPGVIGRVSRCTRGWCWFDVYGRSGYIEQSKLWGVTPGEELE